MQSFDFRTKGLLWSQSNYSSKGIFSLKLNQNKQIITSSDSINGFKLLNNGEMEKLFIIRNYEKPAFSCDWNCKQDEFIFAGNNGRIR